MRQAANWVYLGGFFLVIGAVPAAVYGYWQALIVGIVNTIYGAVRLSAALRDQAAAAK